MGYVLVRKADLAPEIAGGTERSGSQLFTGQGGLQSFIDPARRDLSEIEGSTLGVYPSHFTHPDTGKVHEHPLAGQPIINPRAGQSKYGNLKPAMYGTRGLGALLGLYSAAMAFGGDDDQDALSSALNALGQGYTTYASTAPIEQMMGRIADRGQAQRASDISIREGVDNLTAGPGYALPAQAWKRSGTTGSQPPNPFPTPPSYTTSGHVIPGRGLGSSALGPAVSESMSDAEWEEWFNNMIARQGTTGSIDTGWKEGDTTFDVEGGSDISLGPAMIDSTADDSPPEEEKERKERQTRIDEDWEDGGAWGGRS